MNKIIYRIALIVAIITFIVCVGSEISLLTCLVRSAMVFIGTLFIFFFAGHLLSFGIFITARKPGVNDK